MTRPRSLALGIKCLATLVLVATLGVQRPLEAQTRPCETTAPVLADSSSLEGLVAALAKATACLSGHPGQAKNDRLLLLRTLTELAGCDASLDVSKLDGESALRNTLAHCDAANGARLSDSDLARIRASLAAAGDPNPDATLATLARIASEKFNVFDSIK